jgi:hypothetical protein
MVRNYICQLNKCYSSEDLKAAILKVNQGGQTLKSIAEKYKIPPSTLSENYRLLHPNKHGHKCALSKSDERRIAACLVYAADCGWPLDRTDLHEIIKNYCKNTKLKGPWENGKGPGIEYIRNFETRWHSVLAKRKTVTLTSARAKVNNDILEPFMNMVNDTYMKHRLTETPSAIYNLDETGLNTDQSGKKCFFSRDAKDANVLSPTSGKTMFTVLFCGNADGSHLLPPFVVYKAKHLHSTWTYGGPDGTTYSTSLSGWMEAVQFENWMNVFMQHKNKHHGDKDVILFVDGQYCHLTYNVIRLCQDNNVSDIHGDYLKISGTTFYLPFERIFIIITKSYFCF